VSYLPLLLLLPIINQTALSPISSYLSPAPQPAFIQQGLAQCSAIKAHPEPTAMSFKERRESDRFVEGTKAVVLRNATIWTGNEGGEEVIRGGWVHLDKGLIVAVGQEKDKIPKGVHSVDLNGDWVTPGIVCPSSLSRSLALLLIISLNFMYRSTCILIWESPRALP
jgi:hypothetical protein